MAKVSPEQSVSVIGTGDFGRALAVRLIQGGYTVHMGSQDPGGRREFLEAVSPALARVSLVSIKEALQKSNVVMLAINSQHHESLKQHSEHLVDKILVDCCNPDKSSKKISAAEKLQALLPSAHVCKAFNTTSAYSLSDDNSAGNMVVYVSADDLEVRSTVKRIATDMGLQAVEKGGLQSARELERNQRTLFRGWGWATIVTGVWFALWIIYITCQKYIMDDIAHVGSQWPLNIFNGVLACMAINQLALCYLPGCLAAFIQIARGTKYKAFPRWLDLWLKMRKQLGLYGLAFALMHACASLIIISPPYFPYFYKTDGKNVMGVPTGQGSLMLARTEASFHIAIWATLLYIVLGITSLPSVGALLNWREWRFVQSYMGHFCLLLSCAHACVLKYGMFGHFVTFGNIIQQYEILCQLLAFLAIACRIILWMPCINSYVWKIRKGYVRGAKKDIEQGKKNGHVNESFQMKTEQF